MTEKQLPAQTTNENVDIANPKTAEEAYMAMDIQDEQIVLAEARGAVSEKAAKTLFYSYRVGRDMIEGISKHGADELRRFLAGRNGEKVFLREDPAIVLADEDPEYVLIQVRMSRIIYDEKTGQKYEADSTVRGKRQDKFIRLRDGGKRPNPFWFEMGVSKARRNAILAHTPAGVQAEFLEFAKVTASGRLQPRSQAPNQQQFQRQTTPKQRIEQRRQEQSEPPQETAQYLPDPDKVAEWYLRYVPDTYLPIQERGREITWEDLIRGDRVQISSDEWTGARPQYLHIMRKGFPDNTPLLKVLDACATRRQALKDGGEIWQKRDRCLAATRKHREWMTAEFPWKFSVLNNAGEKTELATDALKWMEVLDVENLLATKQGPRTMADTLRDIASHVEATASRNDGYITTSLRDHCRAYVAVETLEKRATEKAEQTERQAETEVKAEDKVTE